MLWLQLNELSYNKEAHLNSPAVNKLTASCKHKIIAACGQNEMKHMKITTQLQGIMQLVLRDVAYT